MERGKIFKKSVEAINSLQRFSKNHTILGWPVGLVLFIFAVVSLLIGLAAMSIYELAKTIIAFAEKIILYLLKELKNLCRRNAKINSVPTDLGIPKHKPFFKTRR